MIKEYGIDPGCITTEALFYKTVAYFGLEKLRLIRRFPEDWENKVIRALKNEKPRAKHSVVEYLTQIKFNLIDYPKIIEKNLFSYTESKEWLSNAEDYHILNPFDGIVSDKNPLSKKYIKRVTELMESDILFENNGSIRRDAALMAKAVKPLLFKAKEIHFVDPRFGDLKARRLRPLCEFIKLIAIRKMVFNTLPKKIIYHTMDEDSASNDFIESQLKSKVASLLPTGTNLEIIRWPKDEMHNRYILTDVGGVDFHIGLDDDDFNPEKEYDKITPISTKNCFETRGRLEKSECFMSTQKQPSVIIQGVL